MPLMDVRPMLDEAYAGGFAVASFNVWNLETVQAALDAARAESAPVILQVSRGTLRYAGAGAVGALLAAGAEDASDLPVALHFTHADSFEACRQAVAAGFTSVMFDGSALPFEENVRATREVVAMAHAAGVSVEGAAALLGGIEEDVVSRPDPVGLVAEFRERTGVDCLAVAASTSHSAYKHRAPFDATLSQIEQIMEEAPGLPLSIHAGSSLSRELVEEVERHGGSLPPARGLPEEVIGAAARLGVCKVTIDADLRLAFTAKVRRALADNPGELDPCVFLEAGRAGAQELARHKLRLLGAAGKAGAVIGRWRERGYPVPERCRQ